MKLQRSDSDPGSTPLTQPTRRAVVMVAAALIAALLASTHLATAQPAVASETPDTDFVAPVPYEPTGDSETSGVLAAVSVDPLGLVPFPDEVRRYTQGSDVFEVWQCPDKGAVSISAAQFAADAEPLMTTYFSWLSDGQYDPDFIVGGVVPAGEDCSQWASDHATGSSAAALFVTAGSTGFGSPGVTCTASPGTCPMTYPQNKREGFVGVNGGEPDDWQVLLAHEIGHLLSWPHSTTDGGEINNAIDVMSGNFGTWKVGNVTFWGTFPDPYGTTAFNRYQAGWIDPADVVVWNGSDTQLDLDTLSGSGTQMLIVDNGSSFFALDSRTSSSLDPIPSLWEGVEVYKITRCSTCWGIQGDVSAVPPTAFAQDALSSYSKPLAHVMAVGSSTNLSSAATTVVQRVGDSFTVSIESTVFTDVSPDDIFFADIEWLAAEGITKGCNPPANTKFCPDAKVTRAQMAAFLVRAMGYTNNGGGNLFTDDNSSIFENDIDRLATAGVTKGCNPPANTKFCPDAKVTRAQMAAFLVRAMGYTNNGGGNLFTDDNSSIFENDIDRLATAGVTKGCNPPANTQFCPNNFVTRAQMAAFLHRALG